GPTDRPTLISVDSHIGYGAPHKQDTSAAHGEPLGEDEVRLAKRSYGWPEDAQFLVPDGVREHFAAGVGRRGRGLREAWEAKVEAYRPQFPDLADQLHRMQRRELPDGWDAALTTSPPHAPRTPTPHAPRACAGQGRARAAGGCPAAAGPPPPLGPARNPRLTFEGAGDLSAADPGGRNFHFGIRENAMGAIINGMSLTKVRPFGSGFLI